MRFEAVGIDSPWSLSRSEAGFVGGILRQFTRSRESAFAYTFAASAWDYLKQRNKACAMLRRALVLDPDYVPALRRPRQPFPTRRPISRAALPMSKRLWH